MVEPSGAETEAGDSGIDSATRRQTGDVVKEVERCVAAFLCVTRCGQASVSCYTRQLTGSYSGWAETALSGPFTATQKIICDLLPLFFFWCMQLVTDHALEG